MIKLFHSTFFALIVLLLFSAEAKSQQIINENVTIPPRAVLQLRYSFLTHLRIKEPAIQLGAEIKLHEHLGLNLEYGFIHDRFNIFNAPAKGFYRNKREVRGNRKVAELRYYVLRDWTQERLYIGYRMEFEKSIITREDKILRFEGEYSEKFHFVINKRKTTSLLMLGFNLYEKNNISINIFNGIGIMHRVTTNNMPIDAVFIQQRALSIHDRPNDIIIPALLMGFNLSWHIIG